MLNNQDSSTQSVNSADLLYTGSDRVLNLTGYDALNASDVTGTRNTNGTPVELIACYGEVPQASDLFLNQGTVGAVLISLLWVCLAIILAMYIEEVVFIVRNFQMRFRKQKTVYVLGLVPVYATCAIIGVMVPRAGILVDLVSNSYFGLAMYSWMSLVGDYLGTERRAQARGVTTIRLSTLPCCCFLVCLPRPVFNKRTYTRLLIMVYQVTLIRPSLAFISAVLWADGIYTPGILGNNAFTYLACLNTLSTLIAVWGLIITQRAFRKPLVQFRIGLKFLLLQLTLLGTLTGNIIIAVLVSKNIIPCGEFVPSNARATRLDNSFLVVWMLLLSILGRIAFRRAADGKLDTKLPPAGENGDAHELTGSLIGAQSLVGTGSLVGSGSLVGPGVLTLIKHSTESLNKSRENMLNHDTNSVEEAKVVI